MLTDLPAAEAGHAETVISQDAGHVFTLASSGVAGIQTTVAGVVYTALAASGSGSASNSAATSPRHVPSSSLFVEYFMLTSFFSGSSSAALGSFSSITPVVTSLAAVLSGMFLGAWVVL